MHTGADQAFSVGWGPNGIKCVKINKYVKK